MNLWKSYMWTAKWRITWRMIIAVTYATFAVAKRKAEKNSGFYWIRTIDLCDTLKTHTPITHIPCNWRHWYWYHKRLLILVNESRWLWRISRATWAIQKQRIILNKIIIIQISRIMWQQTIVDFLMSRLTFSNVWDKNLNFITSLVVKSKRSFPVKWRRFVRRINSWSYTNVMKKHGEVLISIVSNYLNKS